MRTVSTAKSGMPSAASRNVARTSSGSPGTSPMQQLVHGVVVERLEWQCRRAPRRAREAGMAVGHLGPGEREDEDRVVPAPVEQVLDERDEPFVGPVDVLEDHHERSLLGQPLEEAPPGGEEVLTVGSRAVARGRADAAAEARSSPLLLIADVALERRRAASPPRLSASSSSRIFARPRTISASAQYATPSP